MVDKKGAVPKYGYPVAIIQDRYQGTYSKGKWIALADIETRQSEQWADGMDEGILDIGPWSDDTQAREFWADVAENTDGYYDWIAVGNTPDEALANLLAKGWTL